MIRTQGHRPPRRPQRVGQQTGAPKSRPWPALAALPLILASCAPTPTPSRPAARPLDAEQRKLTPVPATSAAPKPLPTATENFLLPLPEPFSSAVVMKHLVEQQKKLEELARGNAPAAVEAAPEPARGRRSKQRHGRAGRTAPGEAVARTAPAPIAPVPVAAAPEATQDRGKPKGKKSGRSKQALAETVKLPVRRPPTDHWETVRRNLILTGIDHERVVAQLEQMRSRPGSVDSLLKRAEPYLQYLLEEIGRQGLPAELLMVPLVESAFQTSALSPKQAAGIWQFIPTTGQRYGLQLSETFDGRYDTHAATQAALKYLKHLNKLFNGDWLLAFAGYNAGEGAVQRAIDASKRAGLSGSFWDLDLPAETEAYVVKIVALSRIVADPAAYGMKPRRAIDLPSLTRVEAAPEVKIPDLIAGAGIPPEEFYKLNPAFKPDVEPPASAHNFLLPPNHAEALQTANLPGTKVYAPRRVVVQKGETLSILAKRHGVPELKLAEWNGLKPKSHLKAGQELLVNPV